MLGEGMGPVSDHDPAEVASRARADLWSVLAATSAPTWSVALLSLPRAERGDADVSALPDPRTPAGTAGAVDPPVGPTQNTLMQNRADQPEIALMALLVDEAEVRTGQDDSAPAITRLPRSGDRS